MRLHVFLIASLSSVCLSVCQSVSQFVCQSGSFSSSLSLLVCLSVRIYLCWSLTLSILFLSLIIFISHPLSLTFTVRLSLSHSVCPSLSLILLIPLYLTLNFSPLYVPDITKALCRAGLFWRRSGSSSSLVTSPVMSSTSTLAGKATYPPMWRNREEER